jgi:hypothetical protein
VERVNSVVAVIREIWVLLIWLTLLLRFLIISLNLLKQRAIRTRHLITELLALFQFIPKHRLLVCLFLLMKY